MRQRQEQQRTARGQALEDFLHGDGDNRRVVASLIPLEADLVVAQREVRKLMRRADRSVRGPSRSKILDDLVGALARLVFVERVLEMDRLERAALTPAQLAEMSRVIGPEDLQARLAGFRGEGSRVEVDR